MYSVCPLSAMICHTVPKSDDSVRFVTDYRKVNDVTRTDSYPLLRIDTLIDEVSSATYHEA